jgi:hypothetical protein
MHAKAAQREPRVQMDSPGGSKVVPESATFIIKWHRVFTAIERTLRACWINGPTRSVRWRPR